MKKIVFAIMATLFVTGCLFSKKEEAPAEPTATEQAAPADANAPAPAPADAPAEPAPAE
jgi:PBP1b-binding outer membrane lipoprotein LpoB